MRSLPDFMDAAHHHDIPRVAALIHTLPQDNYEIMFKLCEVMYSCCQVSE